MPKSSQKAEVVSWKQAFKELHFTASSRKATAFVPRRSRKLILKPPKLMAIGSAFWMPLVKHSAVLLLQPHGRLRGELWKEPQ